MKTSKMVVKESNSIIHSEEIKKRTVKDYEHHFTRTRKLTFILLVTLILTHFQTTIKTALNHFRPLADANIKVCQSAFSQAVRWLMRISRFVRVRSVRQGQGLMMSFFVSFLK